MFRRSRGQLRFKRRGGLPRRVREKRFDIRGFWWAKVLG